MTRRHLSIICCVMHARQIEGYTHTCICDKHCIYNRIKRTCLKIMFHYTIWRVLAWKCLMRVIHTLCFSLLAYQSLELNKYVWNQVLKAICRKFEVTLGIYLCEKTKKQDLSRRQCLCSGLHILMNDIIPMFNLFFPFTLPNNNKMYIYTRYHAFQTHTSSYIYIYNTTSYI